jgi:hypothetical protein
MLKFIESTFSIIQFLNFRRCFLVFPFLFFALACKTKSSKTQAFSYAVEKSMIVNDQFEFKPELSENIKILSHKIKGTALTLNAEVKNACGFKQFKLITTSAVMKSLPPQKSLFLINEDAREKCNQSTEVELVFDLSVLKSVPYETIVLNIENYTEQIIYRNKPSIRK